MNYDVINPDGKRLIIFLNGAGVGTWMWKYQLKYLVGYKMIVFNYKGHDGDSKKNFISISDVIEEIKEIINREAVSEEIYIVGHSLGAQIALRATKELPIKKAIIISALNKPMKRLLKYIDLSTKFAMPLVKYKWFAKLNAKQLNIKKDMFDDYYRTSRSISYESLKNIFYENMSFDYKERLLDNVRVIVGEKEKKIMLESAKRMVNEPIIIKGAAHDIPYNYFNELNTIISNFFV